MTLALIFFFSLFTVGLIKAILSHLYVALQGQRAPSKGMTGENW